MGPLDLKAQAMAEAQKRYSEYKIESADDFLDGAQWTYETMIEWFKAHYNFNFEGMLVCKNPFDKVNFKESSDE